MIDKTLIDIDNYDNKSEIEHLKMVLNAVYGSEEDKNTVESFFQQELYNVHGEGRKRMVTERLGAIKMLLSKEKNRLR